MRVVMSPVMALSSTSPWLAEMVTGALRAVTFTSPWLALTVVGAAEDNAGEGKEDEDGDDASAYAAAVAGLGGVRLDVLVIGPLEQHDDAGADEQEGPEACVPLPQAIALQMACLDEQEDDAHGDEHEGAENGASAHAAGLIAVGL